jgi:hypothetical protein
MIAVAGPVGLSQGALTGAGAVAARAAAQGEVVEVVATVPDDPSGDAILLALTDAAVRHAAVLRTPAAALDAADLDLALRYLPDIRAIVVIDATADLARSAAAAAGWSDAALVVVTPAGATAPELSPDVEDAALVLAAPPSDPDGAFAGFVASLAVRLAAGATPADAWTQTAAALGVESVSRRPSKVSAGPSTAS